jgi:hypothetical protein
MLRLNIPTSDRNERNNVPQELPEIRSRETSNCSSACFEFAGQTISDEDYLNNEVLNDFGKVFFNGSLEIGEASLEIINEWLKTHKPSLQLRQTLNEMSFWNGSKGSNWNNLVSRVEKVNKWFGRAMKAKGLYEDNTTGAFEIGAAVFLEKIVKISATRANIIGAFLSPSDIGESSFFTPDDFKRMKNQAANR